MCTRFEAKRSKVKFTRPNNAESESELQTWQAVDMPMRYQLPWPAIKVCAVGLLHAGGGIPCRPHPRRPHNLLLLLLLLLLLQVT